MDKIIGGTFATACYPEHGLPLMLCLLQDNHVDFQKSVLANANAGGDNVHRGMILGMLAGASTLEVPEDLKRGLSAYEEIKKEIEAHPAPPVNKQVELLENQRAEKISELELERELSKKEDRQAVINGEPVIINEEI